MRNPVLLLLAPLLLTTCKKSDPAPTTYAVKVNYTITEVDSPYSAEVLTESDKSQGTAGYEQYRHSGLTTTGVYTDSDELTTANKAGRTLTFTVAIRYSGQGPTPPPLPATANVTASIQVDGATKKTLLVDGSTAPDAAGVRTATYSLTL